MLPDGRKQCPFCGSIFDKDNNPENGEEQKKKDTKISTQPELVKRPLDKKKDDEKSS